MSNYYLYDDWSDGKDTGRKSLEVPGAKTLNTYQGILKPSPEWDPEVGITVTNQEYVFPADTNVFSFTPTDFDVGTWQVDFQMQSTVSTIKVWFFPIYQDGNNFWRVTAKNNGDYCLIKADGGTETTPILSSWPVDTVWHTMKVTRDGSGNWELFLDGASQGTVTDTFLPTINTVGLGVYTPEDQCHFDNLKVF